jgi:hypothetical protein
MSRHLELIDTEDNDPVYYLPYTPATEARSGSTVYLADVTAPPRLPSSSAHQIEL